MPWPPGPTGAPIPGPWCASSTRGIGWALVIGPSAFAVIGLGVWLVILEKHWEFSQLWILLSLVLVGVSMALRIGYFGPEGKRISTLEQERGEDDEGVHRRIVRLLWMSRLNVLILLVVLWAMVFKPGG